ncbi:MAG: DUF6677 family protein [Planctomycetota bacterium]|nr:DUF6677 family protein [Planctomycetota bacterium]
MAASSSSQPQPQAVFSPTAAILAWLWPGLGHISLGERKRGLLIMFGVLFLFLGGLLVGGLDCVDRRHDKLWFLAQSFCGPLAFAADIANQRLVQTVPEDWSRGSEGRRRFVEGDPDLRRRLSRIGLGRVNEMGTLFIALAGLMNVVVILDALYYVPPSAAKRREGDAEP